MRNFHWIFVSTTVLALASCGEQGQNFVTSDAGDVEFQVEPDASGNQAALPDISADDADAILKSLDSVAQSSPKSSDAVVKAPGKPSKSSDFLPEADDDSESDRDDDDAEIRSCMALTGASAADIVRVSGNETSVTLKSSSVVAVRVTGNQNQVNLNFAKASGTIRGICVFASGNQSRVTATIGMTVERVVFVARGNQCKGEFNVLTSGKVNSQVVDIAGNGSTFTISGDGEYSASSAVVRGNSGGFICAERKVQ